MKEYDIFLKQRIHESKLFIHSIPYRCYTTGLETAMSIVAQITDTELYYSLGDANSAMVISTSESGGAARKFISLADQNVVLDWSLTREAASEQRLYTGFAVRVGRVATVGCEIPADLDVTYVTDEAGDLLADEAGNRIID